MQLAVSSWSLRDHINKDFPFSQFPQYIKDTFGIRSVEVCQMHIPAPDTRRLDALAAGLASAGVKIVNMPIDVGDISQADESKRNHDLKLIEVWMDAAAYLGSPAARVNSGSGDLPTAVESFRRLAEYGQKIGVKILLENHGGLSDDIDNVRKLLVEMDGGFGSWPDFGNFPEQVRYEGLELMGRAPRLYTPRRTTSTRPASSTTSTSPDAYASSRTPGSTAPSQLSSRARATSPTACVGSWSSSESRSPPSRCNARSRPHWQIRAGVLCSTQSARPSA
ncbi:MAG: TIM barrel protein [Chloroflexia bacterium]